MLKKKRIGLFVLLLATGFMSVGEASAGRGAEAAATGPKQAACRVVGCPDEDPRPCFSGTVDLPIIKGTIHCYEPKLK